MKHALRITLLLILIFILAQVVGLNIVSNYVNIEESSSTGETVIEEDLYFVEPPQVENESNSWALILIPILIGTGIILLLVKFNMKKTWKVWFFLSIFLALAIAIYPYFFKLSSLFWFPALEVTILVALIFAFFKVFKYNVWLHNLTEVFVYGGIAALFVPIINIFSGIILLILIAIYDAYAVWKSKHMVKMAKFQSSSGIFAGLSIPYPDQIKRAKAVTSDTSKKVKKEVKVKTAILGGGDIAFPMLFSGAILKVTGSYLDAYLVIIGATIALSVLLFIGKNNKFYPAMPFISTGCLLGYLLGLLI